MSAEAIIMESKLRESDNGMTVRLALPPLGLLRLDLPQPRNNFVADSEFKITPVINFGK